MLLSVNAIFRVSQRRRRVGRELEIR